jgi:dTDP-4-dehydrorhamnose reductase
MTMVLLGAGGQLANDLATAFSSFDIVPLGRAQLDIADFRRAAELLRSLKPSILINTAAYNRVDDAEEQVESAFATNAFAVRRLARLCEELQCVLVHYSTDYVFGNSAERSPLTEDDRPAPLSVYGASKLCGEYFVQANCQRHFIIRTCGLYGFRGTSPGGNFVEAILRAAQRTPQVRVVNDQTCSPSYTEDVAQATARLIETSAYGTYHVTGSGQCTWYDFAREILGQTGSKTQCAPITTAEYGARARRPSFSVLSNEKLVAAGIPANPSWQDGLARYLRRRSSL